MEAKAIKYQVETPNSYSSLAAYVTTLPCEASLFPLHGAIVVPEDARKAVDEFIDAEGLADVAVSVVEADEDNIDELLKDHTCGVNILREIAQATRKAQKDVDATYQKELNIKIAERDAMAARCNQYKDWWQDTVERNNRMDEQVRAIAVLINSICPKK